ncbi:MAG: hypothetical protein HY744_21625 [Deltaproteobacteria bacterium]|nr:hypothetical protein [Deltaproteobacteria bacterium]
MDNYRRLHALLSATEPLSEGAGGSHTDVLRFDRQALRASLARWCGRPTLSRSLERLAEELGERYLVKKGKIDFFSMPLVRRRTTHLRRSMVSYAFGTVGYNIMPTYDKALLDATEAARLIPYFGFGPPGAVFAPDFLAWMEADPEQDGVPRNEEATFLRVIMRGLDLRHCAYDLWRADEYLHVRIGDAAQLGEFQRFARRNPLVPAMEERLSAFFEAPITVGVRDTLRWLRGSRHTHVPWEQARTIIERCFERFGDQCFLVPEITYYSYDTRCGPAHIQTIYQCNEAVARALSARIYDDLSPQARALWRRHGDAQLAFEVLDFHHDYPLYQVEPYAGFLSTSMLRFAARFGTGFLWEVAHLPPLDVRNLDLARLPGFHLGMAGFLGALDEPARQQAMATIGRQLALYRRRGLRDSSGRRLEFERIPRTFYTFQQLASAPGSGRRALGTYSLHELWEPKHADLWQRHPELGEQLVVFFATVYRYFIETDFCPDLRPRDAGRDVFLWGIWGYVTENLIVVEEQDDGGTARLRLAFVDNRDQFKQYKRGEDRRRPLGSAKHGLRLVAPVVEPAMQRSLGIFVQHVKERTVGLSAEEQDRRPLAPLDRGLDVARHVVRSSLDSAWTTRERCSTTSWTTCTSGRARRWRI